jgi:VWFA-related protein
MHANQLLLVLLLALGISLSASADPPAEEPLASGLEEEVDVVLREVTFLALDREGQPVTDLRRDEIQLWEEGERREIILLERAASGTTADREPGATNESPARHDAEPEAPAKGQDDSSAPAEAPPPEPRWVVLYFDAGNTAMASRYRAAAAAAEMVRSSLAPRDRVAIVVDDSEVRLVQPFTTDHSRILGLLAQADDLSIRNRDIEVLLDSTREQAEDCHEQRRRVSCVRQAVQSLVFELSERTEETFDHLETFLNAMAPIPGRKLVFYFSDGFVVNPGRVASGLAQYAIGQTGVSLSALESYLRRDFSGELADLYQAAVEARVSFYPVNCMGYMSDEWMSPSRPFRGDEMLPQARRDAYEETYRDTHKTQTRLAQVTGGATVFERDPQGHLGPQLDTARGVYVVGFHPGRKGGRNRNIKIRADRPGVELQYRNRLTLRPLKSYRQANGSIELAPDAYDRRTGILRTTIALDAGAFRVVEPTGEAYSAVSYYYEVSEADTGEVLQTHHEVVGFPRPEGAGTIGQSGEFERPFALRLRPGTYRLQVNVWDLHGQARGSLSRTFSVGTKDEAAAEEPAAAPEGA